MKIEFVGGARTVTGSSYIIKDDDFCIMVDCGMFQGRHELSRRNNLELIYAPDKIDALLLTHAHIDHSGLIPKLVKGGFYGNIYATKPTAELCSIMLPDCAHVQEVDLKFINRRNKKLGLPLEEPLYNIEDAEKAMENFVSVSYDEIIQIHPRVKACFRDAGHILGASILEVWVEEHGKQTKIVFFFFFWSKDQALVKDLTIIEEADYVLIESTYGNRQHKNKSDTYDEFKDIINALINSKGNIVIPSFAVERTQEVIYIIHKMQDAGDIPIIPVYIDSPMAIFATEIFQNNKDYLDEETMNMLDSGKNPLEFENLHFVRTTEESKMLNKIAHGAIIISASGMCTAGRIKYHLANNIYNPNSSVVFVGYQAEGTLGRRIIEGAKRINLYGEEVVVNAQIHTLGGFSAHADKSELLEWIGHFKNKDIKVFVVHGEEVSSTSLSDAIKETYGFRTYTPRWGEIIDLETNKSTMADYGVTPEYSDVDLAIDQLFKSMEELKRKYHKSVSESKRFGRKRILNDIHDLDSIIDAIIDDM
jgi:metallo-beta-lactamase family protein